MTEMDAEASAFPFCARTPSAPMSSLDSSVLSKFGSLSAAFLMSAALPSDTPYFSARAVSASSAPAICPSTAASMPCFFSVLLTAAVTCAFTAAFSVSSGPSTVTSIAPCPETPPLSAIAETTASTAASSFLPLSVSSVCAAAIAASPLASSPEMETTLPVLLTSS